MLLHGFIRDYISNGVTRIEMYILLSFGLNRQLRRITFKKHAGLSDSLSLVNPIVLN